MINYIPACEMYDFDDLNDALSIEYARESAMVLGFDYEEPAYEGIGEKVKGAKNEAVNKLKEIGTTIKTRVEKMLEDAEAKINKACEAHPKLKAALDALNAVYTWAKKPLDVVVGALVQAKDAIKGAIHERTAPKAETEEAPSAESFFDFDFDFDIATEADGEKVSVSERVRGVLASASDNIDKAHAAVDEFTKNGAVKIAAKFRAAGTLKAEKAEWKENNPDAKRADWKNYDNSTSRAMHKIGVKNNALKTAKAILDGAKVGVQVAPTLDSSIIGAFVGILSRAISLVAKVIALPVRVLHMVYTASKDSKEA